MSDDNKQIEVVIKEVEATILDVKPGQTLAITVKSNDIDEFTINSLRQNLNKAFPGVRVLLFGIGLDDDIRFTAISEIKPDKEISSCATGQFCVDCNCGKKEQYEKA